MGTQLEADPVTYFSEHGLKIEKVATAIGAEVSGVDMRKEIPQQVRGDLRKAIWAHGVLFFREQEIDDEQLVAFGRVFGEITPNPRGMLSRVMTDGGAKDQSASQWHTDGLWMEAPPDYTVLLGIVTPALGGDTCFSSGVAAYEGLPSEIKDRIADLRFSADMEKLRVRYPTASRKDPAQMVEYARQFTPSNHPVVRVHPETGQKVLYVSESRVDGLIDVSGPEADELLRYLSDQFKRPEYQVRMKWRKNSVCIWDNRLVQHYAVPDPVTDRELHRITVGGGKPFGIAEAQARSGARPAEASPASLSGA
jgi:taurine dioxygenase